MTPSEDEKVTRAILADTVRWRDQPAAREAAAIRTRLEHSRVFRAQSVLTYLTADRSTWPEAIDQMLRDELGIDSLLVASGEHDSGGEFARHEQFDAAAIDGSGG